MFLSIILLSCFLIGNTYCSFALDVNQKRAQEHYQLGNVYYQHGLYEEAASEFRKALQLLGKTSTQTSPCNQKDNDSQKHCVSDVMQEDVFTETPTADNNE